MEESVAVALFLKSEPLEPSITSELQSRKIDPKCLKLLSFDYEAHEKELMDKLKHIEAYKGLAMNSTNAVNAMLRITTKYPDFKLGTLPSVCVVGEKTAIAMRSHFQTDPVLIGKNLAELMPSMKEHFNKISEGSRILYLVGSLSDISSYVSPDDKCLFDTVVCYETIECSEEDFYLNMDELKIDEMPKVIVHFSPSNAKNFAKYIHSYLELRGKNWNWEEIEHLAFGDKTKEELEKQKDKLRINDITRIHVCKMSQVKEIPSLLISLLRK